MLSKKKIKLYLDNCCFNRPFDDQYQKKIYLETEAKLYIQKRIIEGYYDFVWSFMLDYENSANPDIEAKMLIQKWEKICKETILLSNDLLVASKKINEMGFGIKDSIHIACALVAKCNYFLTVDKRILKKKNKINDLIIINPIDFVVMEEEL
ncbi:MAG: hypothetical protein N2053_04115 [Chitinispirillaceae bacterium]|nr:hypothetical protein [Chitinispirillaceae bacterium]